MRASYEPFELFVWGLACFMLLLLLRLALDAWGAWPLDVGACR